MPISSIPFKLLPSLLIATCVQQSKHSGLSFLLSSCREEWDAVKIYEELMMCLTTFYRTIKRIKMYIVLTICHAHFQELFMKSFNSMMALSGESIPITSVEKWENQGKERLTNLPKFAQIIGDRAVCKTQQFGFGFFVPGQYAIGSQALTSPPDPSSKSVSCTSSLPLHKRGF